MQGSMIMYVYMYTDVHLPIYATEDVPNPVEIAGAEELPESDEFAGPEAPQ